MCADADLLCERLLSVVSRRRRRGSLRTSVTCPPGLSAPFSLHGPLSHVLDSTPCERDRLGRSWDSVRSVCRKWGIIAASNASTRKSSNLGYHVDIVTRHHDIYLHTTATLQAVERALRGTTDADGARVMATPVASLSGPVWVGHLPHLG